MPLYEEVRVLARELARMGCDIVTDGGPGLMQAANAGVIESGPHGRETALTEPLAMQIPRCVLGVGEAIELIRTHHLFWGTPTDDSLR
jgi:predicted Rossmann-fold nucleotide-binding protein